LSAHCLGKAADFNIQGVTPTEAREWIVQNADKFPCKVRLEEKLRGKEINWIHLDVYQNENNPKVYKFNV